jgi:cyclohexanone monooxygenase
VFQRTANYTIPAHNRPLDPAYVREVKANYREMRKRAKTLPAGIDLGINNVSAVETPDEERRRQYQERWDYGGLGFMASFNDLLLNDDSNKTAAEFVREKIREIVKDPEDGGDPVADQHHRLQAAVRRHRLLGDLQPPNVTLVDIRDRADRAHHADRARAPAARTTPSTAWCWRPASTP